MRLQPAFALLLLPLIGSAQETVAPSSLGERTMSPRGDNAGNYNIAQSWETGVRFASVGGDDGKYRSDVNYGNGLRLLSSYLTINSQDGRGHLFDEITLTTQGLATDPYQSATLRVEKNRWYRYDLLLRSNDYFNPGLTVADGEHLENTTYRWQNHDLTVLPDSWFRLHAGYSHTTQNGPALTTEQEFDPQGDVFPLFRDTRQTYDEYRLGGDLILKSFHLSVLHRWEYFKDDTTDNLTFTEQGAPADPSLLTGFARSQPYRGTTSGWLVTLYEEQKRIAINGRFTYAGGRGDFIQQENALGTSRLGTNQNVQTIATGSGDRPVLSGDLSITLFPRSRLSLTNETFVSDTRMEGNNSYEQFNNASATAQVVNFQFLGIRLITNATDLKYRYSKKLDLFAGFRYSDWQIRSIEDSAPPGLAFDGLSAERSNQLRAGVAGVNWIPLKDLRLHLETEIGRNSNPFTPISLRNYSVIRGRARYSKQNYNLSAGYLESYNNNSIVITAYSSHSRTYSADASWRAKPWLMIDASYSRLHLDTVGGIAFFAGTPATPLNQQSIYISNIHAGNLSLRIPLKTRAELYVGYSLTKDTGDGRLSSSLVQATPAAQLLYSVQTFPLTYQTPLVRLSIKLTAKVRYNVGYQYYGYHEDFGLLSVDQNYRANTGFTSLLWSF